MLIEEGKKLFFPNGKSPNGDAIDMDFDIANFKGDSIDDRTEPFTVQTYIEKNKLTQIRLYLTSKFAPLFSFDDEDLMQEPDDDDIQVISFDTEESSEDLHVPESDDEDQLLYSVFDNTSTQLIGSSEERKKLRDEQEQLFQQSLDEDRRKENEKRQVKEKEQKEEERLQDVRSARSHRVPPQPDPGLPQVRIAVNHISLGKVIRSFSTKEKILAVYDWVGSLALYPEHFSLCQFQGQSIKPSEPVTSVENCTLYMEGSHDPMPICSEDSEVSFKGFAGTSEMSSNDDTLPSFPSTR
ncbi:hypothetical protein QZH41_004831 [Actinostola sp. cb2023]|nr:hypothetical protein QZH41_004831 [Actinostola sp. cb2023]